MLQTSRRNNSESGNSAAAFDTRALKVEGEPSKVKNPLQKAGRFLPVPLGSNRVKRIAKTVVGALHWVRRHTKALLHEPEENDSSKGQPVRPFRSKASASERSLGQKSRATQVLRFSCLAPRVRPPTESTHSKDGSRRTSVLEFVSSQDEAVHHGHVRKSHGRTLDPHTRPHDLLRLSEAVGKSLNQDFLFANLSSNKTTWEIITGGKDLVKYAHSILDRIFKEIRDKLENENPSTSVDSTEVPYTNDAEDNELYLSLCNSFDEVSIAASGFGLRAISTAASCIEECQDITDFASASLFQSALDLVNSYSRVCRIREKMIIKRRGELAVIDWGKEQEESRVEALWKLVKAVTGCVVNIQNRVLQLALAQPPGTGTHNEEQSRLESHLQQSWTWLNRISKRVAVLCPSRKQVLFVYLLERFIDATGELSQYQKLLPVLNDPNCKQRVSNAAASCHKILLHSLMKLLKRAEEAGLEIRKEGLAAACDFVEITDASKLYAITLPLLLSLLVQQRGTNVSQSHHFDQTLKRYGMELMCFAKPCVQVIGVLASQVSNHGARRPPRPPRRRIVANTTKQAKSTPFARPENVPVIETPEAAPGAEEASAPSITVELNYFELSSEEVIDSLDRRLPHMPSHGHFSKVDINTMTEVRELGEGASGEVHLMKLCNGHVAVKKSTFPDPVKARNRLARECDVHQRIAGHPNIVRFLRRAVQTDDDGNDQIVGIVTEWCESGDLSNAIKEAAEIRERDRIGEDVSTERESIGYQLYTDWTKRLEVVSDIAAGMVYMHDCNIVHRDLTSTNIFLNGVDKSGRIEVKIGDFERAFYLPGGEPIQRTKAYANSIPWMGPEVLKHERYGLLVDVFSIGTVLWELMFLRNPWAYLKESFMNDETLIRLRLTQGKLRLQIPEDDAPDVVPEFPDLVKLVKRAREWDPDNRPTMAEFYAEVVGISARMKERMDVGINET